MICLARHERSLPGWPCLCCPSMRPSIRSSTPSGLYSVAKRESRRNILIGGILFPARRPFWSRLARKWSSCTLPSKTRKESVRKVTTRLDWLTTFACFSSVCFPSVAIRPFRRRTPPVQKRFAPLSDLFRIRKPFCLCRNRTQVGPFLSFFLSFQGNAADCEPCGSWLVHKLPGRVRGDGPLDGPTTSVTSSLQHLPTTTGRPRVTNTFTFPVGHSTGDLESRPPKQPCSNSGSSLEQSLDSISGWAKRISSHRPCSRHPTSMQLHGHATPVDGKSGTTIAAFSRDRLQTSPETLALSSQDETRRMRSDDFVKWIGKWGPFENTHPQWIIQRATSRTWRRKQWVRFRANSFQHFLLETQAKEKSSRLLRCVKSRKTSSEFAKHSPSPYLYFCSIKETIYSTGNHQSVRKSSFDHKRDPMETNNVLCLFIGEKKKGRMGSLDQKHAFSSETLLN